MTKRKNITDIFICLIVIALICMLLLSHYALSSALSNQDEKSRKRVKPSTSPVPSPSPSRPMMIGPDTAVFTDLALFTY